jgi:hypothetical protein
MTSKIAAFQRENLADPGHLPQEFLSTFIKSHPLDLNLQMKFFLSLQS